MTINETSNVFKNLAAKSVKKLFKLRKNKLNLEQQRGIFKSTEKRETSAAGLKGSQINNWWRVFPSGIGNEINSEGLKSLAKGNLHASLNVLNRKEQHHHLLFGNGFVDINFILWVEVVHLVKQAEKINAWQFTFDGDGFFIRKLQFLQEVVKMKIDDVLGVPTAKACFVAKSVSVPTVAFN